MARSRWTLAGQGAGEGFAAGFNYGMKPNLDRKNSLADLKAKVDQLGKYNPEQMNVFQRAALGGEKSSGGNVLEQIAAVLLASQFPDVDFSQSPLSGPNPSGWVVVDYKAPDGRVFSANSAEEASELEKLGAVRVQ